MNEEFQCPACRKGAPVASAAPCQRCDADLEPLRRILRVVAREHALARAALAERRWQDAAAHATGAWTLHRTRRSAELGFLAALGDPTGDDPALWLARSESVVAG